MGDEVQLALMLFVQK
uniref:Uncharacterized protein n=1 Tax=Anguilla anguilla TaxID=7936 RepID=A0A0E9QW53_ANGAN